ncbi:MAG: hypothetical protein RLZZ09_675, partial [Pseudomonadota bacterium]
MAQAQQLQIGTESPVTATPLGFIT